MRTNFGSLALAFMALGLCSSLAGAQTAVKPGFNIFSVSQDIEIGKQSAAQVERQLPLLSDAATQRYVAALGARLAVHAPGPKFPYQFKVANLSDLNAFALPGGFIYVHRGLLQQVRSEGELAGVMSHEIAHIALRHPTNQASKAYLAKAGLGVLGGRLGGGGSSTGKIMNSVGGFGMNTLFLKFSRSAETQADIVGSQIMAKAGYDPVEMATFFAYMGKQAGGNPGSVAGFLSSHPAPVDREARVRREANLLGAPRRTPSLGALATIQTRLGSLPAARSTAQVARNVAPSGGTPTSSTGLSIDPPSARFRAYQQRSGSFTIEQPDNWVAGESSNGFGVTFLPRGGIETNSRGFENIGYGVIVNHFVPLDGVIGTQFIDADNSDYGTADLAQATSDLVRQLRQANPYLTRRTEADRRTTIAGGSAMEVHLAGRSPQSGRDESVTVVAREVDDGHIIYLLLIAPSDETVAMKPTFDRMVRSLRVNDQISHH